ncbi:MAG: hypothetical protein ED557_03350 [Balneola sp.]|nr:MAG: hypothetical protein ED557_03350 [Balneola sp.]
MSFKKISLGLLLLYFVGLHAILFLLYFEKIEYNNEGWPRTLTTICEDGSTSFSETKQSYIYQYEADGTFSIVGKKELAIYGDSLAVLTEYFSNYKSIIFLSDEKGRFWGRLNNNQVVTNLFLKRGNCMITPDAVVGEFVDRQKAEELRQNYQHLECEFKPNDAPYEVYLLTKIHNGFKLIYF